eukprot:TRINITY_DN9647_c2_g1_i1.p2 TRINITY_DN9647_c2_g1~~TRINITY_DN9647_c2_g1_i1.p2  ORF type:complete len:109 (-),score=13.59 TRINITY_DN9647_c2_g1_i1:64-390(-)
MESASSRRYENSSSIVASTSNISSKATASKILIIHLPRALTTNSCGTERTTPLNRRAEIDVLRLLASCYVSDTDSTSSGNVCSSPFTSSPCSVPATPFSTLRARLAIY